MFIEFILRIIENILLAYFLGCFLNLEDKKEYVLKTAFLGSMLSFFSFSTFLYLGSLFLMHFIFLEYIQKERRVEHVLYPLLLVLILFVCNCYSESLYGYIGVQNVLILQLFLFLSKMLFGGVCLFINEMINGKKDVYHIFKETIICIICFYLLYFCKTNNKASFRYVYTFYDYFFYFIDLSIYFPLFYFNERE